MARHTHGTCPACQQNNLRIYWSMEPDTDPGRVDDEDVPTPILYDHDHQGGSRCEGSGQMAQATYNERA